MRADGAAALASDASEVEGAPEEGGLYPQQVAPATDADNGMRNLLAGEEFLLDYGIAGIFLCHPAAAGHSVRLVPSSLPPSSS